MIDRFGYNHCIINYAGTGGIGVPETDQTRRLRGVFRRERSAYFVDEQPAGGVGSPHFERRTPHATQAIVLAKALHFQHEEAAFPLTGVTFLDLGCGAGLLGIYLACLGARALLADVPSVRDLTERNISLNRALVGGRAEFAAVNW